MTDDVEDFESEEFLPPDEDQIEWLIGLSQQLKLLSDDYRFTFNERSMLGVSSRQIVRLLSMTMAGFHLYANWRELALMLKFEIENVLDNHHLHDGLLDISHFPSLQLDEKHILATIKEDFNEY